MLVTEKQKQEALSYLESLRWPTMVISPLNPDSKVYKDSIPNSFVCKVSNRKFTVLSKTYMDGCRKSIVQWVRFVDMLLAKSTEKEIADEIGLSAQSKYDMYRRILDSMHLDIPYSNRYLHNTLLRKIYFRKTTKDEIWTKLLKEK